MLGIEIVPIDKSSIHASACTLDAMLGSVIERAGGRVDPMQPAQGIGHDFHFLDRVETC